MHFKNILHFLLVLLAIVISSTDAAKKPTTPSKKIANILLVHGAIADGSSWGDVIPILQAAGYNVTAVQQPLSSLPDDIAKTKVALATLPAPVIIVGHSFGGVVITNAAYNASNVAGLVYVAAFGPDEGESVTDLGKNFAALPSSKLFVPDSAGRVTLSQPNFVKYFAPDVNKTKARVMAAAQGPCDQGRFVWKSGPPTWKAKPSWHVVAGNDQIINPDIQVFGAKRMKAKKVVRVPGSSHAVMVSHPKEVAALILEAAKAVASK
ncbi:hypothetical protein BGZ83_008689 [Gryganskiella cystojenkinii]|nr:hypothetical protein BGZ83_008689 [Gryganskiella cystojenkinii]